jgi:hypothetical protein
MSDNKILDRLFQITQLDVRVAPEIKLFMRETEEKKEK